MKIDNMGFTEMAE